MNWLSLQSFSFGNECMNELQEIFQVILGRQFIYIITFLIGCWGEGTAWWISVLKFFQACLYVHWALLSVLKYIRWKRAHCKVQYSLFHLPSKSSVLKAVLVHINSASSSKVGGTLQLDDALLHLHKNTQRKFISVSGEYLYSWIFLLQNRKDTPNIPFSKGNITCALSPVVIIPGQPLDQGSFFYKKY